MTTVSRTIILKCKDPDQREAILGASPVTPGMLIRISGANTVLPANSSSVELMFAVERGIDGKGIDVNYTIANEVVDYFKPSKGDVIYGLLKAGQNVSAGDMLANDSAGGLLKTTDGTYAFAKAIEAVDNSLGTGYARIRVEMTGNMVPSVSAVFPAITVQPADDSIASGNTSTLSVTATGAATLHYQWYEGLAGVTTTPVGTDSNSYTTPALTATKKYWVKVYNTYGEVNSSVATVTVT